MRRGVVLAIGAGLLGALLALTMLIHGPILTPDGWAYWEGSVSLLSGRGYRYFGGEYIRYWPPGLSVVLGGIQALLGVSGLSVSIAMVAAVATASALWAIAIDALLPEATPLITRGSGAVALTAGFACWGRELTANLFAVVLLGAVAALLTRGQRSSLMTWLAAVAILFLPLVHASMLVLMPAVWLWAAGSGDGSLLQGLRRAWWVPAAAAASVVLLAGLGIFGGQRLEGFPTDSPASYAGQALTAVVSLIGPDRWRLGPVMLAAVGAIALFAISEDRRWAGPVGLVVLGVPLLVVLFSTTFVQDPLGGRFVLFAWPVLVGVIIRGTTLTRAPARACASVLLVAVLGIQAWRVEHWLAHPGDLDYPSRASWRTTLDPDYVFGPPQAHGARMLVAPPTYPWLARATARQ
jgi:hypothetical protein